MRPSHPLARVLPGSPRATWRLLATCLLLLACVPAAAQYDPLGYWRFENPQPAFDASGNGHHIVNNANQILLVPGVLGTALDIPSNVNQPATLATIDDSANVNLELSTEFWFKPSVGLHDGTISWPGKQEIVFAPQMIEWYLNFNGGPQLAFKIELAGANALDPHQVYDGNWHHWAFTFNAKTGEQKVYFDGVCPPGFSRVLGATTSLHDGGPLAFSYHLPAGRMEGRIDEYAVYDTVIPPALVWQHYQQGVLGQPYTFTPSPAYAAPPAPTTQLPGMNPLEFAPGYPNIGMSTVELIDHYPMPRYNPIAPKPRRLFPWMSSSDFQFLTTGGNTAAGWRNMATWLTRLHDDWNNYLYPGDLQGLSDWLIPAAVLDTNQPGHHMLNMLNQVSAGKADRATVTNWVNVRPNRWISTLPNTAFITRRQIGSAPGTQLPPHWFIRDATNGNSIVQGPPNVLYHHNLAMANPAYPADTRLDSLRYDGLANRPAVDNIFSYTTFDYFDMVGENDEVIIAQAKSTIDKDLEILQDINTHGWTLVPGGNYVEYQSQRINTMREAYRDSFYQYIRQISLASQLGRQTELWWFEIKGGNRESYPQIRDITDYRDGRRRPGPTFYPQGTAGWLIGSGSTPGWLSMVRELDDQLYFLDSIMMPAVSPGFEGGGPFYVVDSNNIRPGSYLGMLKAMHLLGAESFVTFEYQGVSPRPDANMRTWKLPIPAYAQAIGTRASEFWSHGEILVADSSYVTPVGSVGPTRYTFDTGNLYDLVTGRKEYGTERYLLTASVQRSVNQTAQAPKEKDIKIQLRRNNGSMAMADLQLKARNQGSTYVLDLNNAAQPLIYQLDTWHEWKDMTWWCRDYTFEAELPDNFQSAFTRRTERPAGVAPGDFRDFTTFIEFRTGGSQWADYQFRPRWDDQDTLYLWLHARRVGPAACTLQVKLGGTPVGNVVINDTTFSWEGAGTNNQPILLAIPAPAFIWQTLTLERVTGEADIDVVALNRSPQDFSQKPLEAIISASSLLGCTGEEFGFEALGQTPAGCLDYHWRFGDGGQAYTPNAHHAYPVPGIYQVILDVTATCDGRTVSDTITVTVRAPFVDAGPPVPVCAGDTAQLQGQATSPFQWQAHPSLGSTTVLDPLAWPSTLQWYTLTVDSAGCTASDSTPVTPVQLGALSATADTTLCLGAHIDLVVNGAFSVVWDPNPTLSATNVHNPTATPVADHNVYYYTATDVCGCDTIRDSIVVDVTCCPGVTVDALLSNPVASTWTNPTSGGTYQIRGVFLIDQPITFNNTTFLMESSAEVRIVQGGTLTANNGTFISACGDSMWIGIDLVHAAAQLNLTGCHVEDAIQGVHSRNGAGFAIRGSEFRDNWIGVHYGLFTGTHAGEVRGTRFVANAQTMLPPYSNFPAEAGVWIEDVTKATVGLPGGSNRNRFDSLAIGVLCIRSHADVQNADFNSIQLKPDQKGRPGNGGYGCGVFAKGNPGVQVPAFKVVVGEETLSNNGRSCRFTDCPTGIYVRENIALRAGRDTIDGQLRGVYGVRMDLNTSDTLLVRNCRFKGTDFGIYSVLNGGAATRILANDFSSTDTIQRGAVYVYDFNTFNLPTSNLKGTLINGNHIRQDGVGIEVNGVAKLEISNNTVITTGLALPVRARYFAVSVHACDGARILANELSNQNSTWPISGLWLNWSGRDTVHCNWVENFDVDIRTWGSCNFSELRDNRMVLGNTGLLLESNGLIGVQGSPTNATYNQWLGGTWTCGTSTGRYMARTDSTNYLDNFYVVNSQTQSPVHSANPLCNGANAGSPINFIPPSQNGSALVCPVAGTGGSNGTNVAQQGGGGYDGDGVSSLRAIALGQTDYLGNANAARYMERQMVLAILTEHPQLLDDPVLRDFWQAQADGGIGRILEATRLAAEGGFAGMPALLDFIPVNVLESTHQDALTAYLRWMTDTWKGADDSLLIADIAARCPLDYGKGVYQARALMSLLTPGLDWEDNCGGAQRSSGAQAGTAQQTADGQVGGPTLSPNPARGEVELSCGADMDVEVFSYTGQPVARFRHAAGSTQVQVAGWAQGVYVFRCRLGDRVEILRLVVD